MKSDALQLSCPVPLSNYPQIILGHGGGGKLSAELMETVFLPAFGNHQLNQLRDSSVLLLEGGRYAFSTDTYVVRPLFFSGGSIGHLAVHGTVNDLAMSGARPLVLSAGFILEEGFPIEQLQRIVTDMASAARETGVLIVTGDTKVVQRGHGDGCYINTSGIGAIPADVDLSATKVQVGDAVLVSGTLADHGMTIMSEREGLQFEAPISSDTAALHELVQALLAACPETRVLRDPTRGGLSATLNELATAATLGIEILESAIPVTPVVQSACEILGIDPMSVANEGKLVAIVPSAQAQAALLCLQAQPLGRQAAIIGQVQTGPAIVTAKTALGASRVVTLPLGELLPRIC